MPNANMEPIRKIKTMLYHTQQSLRLTAQGKYDEAALLVCSIENTARRWGPPEVRKMAIKAWDQIKSGHYGAADDTLGEICELLEGMLD